MPSIEERQMAVTSAIVIQLKLINDILGVIAKALTPKVEETSSSKESDSTEVEEEVEE